MQGGGGGAAGSGPVKKVFVGGTAHGTTEDDIRAYFQQYGTVSCCFFPPKLTCAWDGGLDILW